VHGLGLLLWLGYTLGANHILCSAANLLYVATLNCFTTHYSAKFTFHCCLSGLFDAWWYKRSCGLYRVARLA
jgi:hypothetical protein